MTAKGKRRVAKKTARKIRYAVVGLGYISQVAVLPAFKNARRNSELAALVSGDPLKRKQLGAKYKVPKTYAYEQYDQCLHSGEIDAVYIALPNSMHRDFAVRAARAGIHVLCEKPLAVNAQDCEEMIQAAAANDVKLMTGYRLHFEKATLKAIDIVKSGKLGEPRIFNSIFSMQVVENNIRLRKPLGGGTLYDIGIYCINAARSLFESEPYEVRAFLAKNDDERFNEVEEMASVVLRFPENRIATFTCSFGAADVSAYKVVGTKGTIEVNPAYDFAKGLKIETNIKDKKSRQAFPKCDQFAPELLYFSDCILENRDPEPSGKEGLADVRIINALYQSAETGEPLRLAEFNRENHPSMEQAILRPPVKKPELIHATNPSP